MTDVTRRNKRNVVINGALDWRNVQQKVWFLHGILSYLPIVVVCGHTLRWLKGQFTITYVLLCLIVSPYACIIGYVHISGVFGAVKCISCSSSLMPILRMGGSVPLPCLYNFMACRAADPCLLSWRRRRRRLFPNLFPSSERCNSVMPHHCLWCGMLQIWWPLLQCNLILSK